MKLFKTMLLTFIVLVAAQVANAQAVQYLISNDITDARKFDRIAIFQDQVHVSINGQTESYQVTNKVDSPDGTVYFYKGGFLQIVANSNIAVYEKPDRIRGGRVVKMLTVYSAEEWAKTYYWKNGTGYYGDKSYPLTFKL